MRPFSCFENNVKYSLNGLCETIRAVWDHKGGSAGNHPVVVVKEVLL